MCAHACRAAYPLFDMCEACCMPNLVQFMPVIASLHVLHSQKLSQEEVLYASSLWSEVHQAHEGGGLCRQSWHWGVCDKVQPVR